VDDGVLALGKKLIVEGAKKPVTSYTLPPSCARALRNKNRFLSVIPRDRLQQQGSVKGHQEAPESDVHCSEADLEENAEGIQPTHEKNGHAPNPENLSIAQNPVPEGDLEEEGQKGASKRTKGEADEKRATAEEIPSPEVEGAGGIIGSAALDQCVASPSDLIQARDSQRGGSSHPVKWQGPAARTPLPYQAPMIAAITSASSTSR
jgi:hypothetical protein